MLYLHAWGQTSQGLFAFPFLVVLAALLASQVPEVCCTLFWLLSPEISKWFTYLLDSSKSNSWLTTRSYLMLGRKLFLMPANQKYKADMIFPVQQTSKNLPAFKGELHGPPAGGELCCKERVLSSVVDHEWG